MYFYVILGDLLHRLKMYGGTDEYIEQLIPTSTPISKIKVIFANNIITVST